MPLALALPLMLVAALACGSAVYYAVVLLRIHRTARWLPTVRAGLDRAAPEQGWPALCIVIPAHNEEAVISELASSLVRQDYPALAIVFALDRCTDRTREKVEQACATPSGAIDPRVEIIEIDRCPEGWAGKTHAAWSGVRRSRGAADARLLLFADADTIFEPGLSRAAVSMLLERHLDLLSLLSRLTCERWFERLVQPAAGFELVRQYPLDFVNRSDRPRAFANGQFMLFTRDLYERIGGHELVKAELLEDIAFARHLDRVKKSMPSRWGVLMSGGLLHCRMYRDWPAFRRGWKRIYTEASLRRPAQLREWAWRAVLVGSVMPCACIAAVAFAIFAPVPWTDPLRPILLASGILGSLATLAALARVYRDQGAPAFYLLAYPYGAWRVALLLRDAASDLDRGVKTVWAGMEYARRPQP